MLGMGEKKKKVPEFVFELEKELAGPEKQKQTKAHIETRIQEIKKALRDGANRKEFETLGLILHGYTALLKVISRISPAKGK